jgi:protein-S-isoprenylcysteine O-methyltransferase Ste14
MLEVFFKVAFFVVFFSFAYVMSYYSKQAKARNQDKAARVKLHNENEVPLLLKIRTIFGIPFYIGILVWTFTPKFMEWSAASFPAWVRWIGLALGVFSIFVNAQGHKTLSQKLGEDFDPALRLAKVPTLVKEGIYAKIRHPIYLAFLLMQISVLFLTANWLIGLCGLAIIGAVIAIRIPEEERLLIEQFGDGYREYMRNAGMLWPRLK